MLAFTVPSVKGFVIDRVRVMIGFTPNVMLISSRVKGMERIDIHIHRVLQP